MKTKVSLQTIRLFALVAVAGLALWQVSLRVDAQKTEKPRLRIPRLEMRRNPPQPGNQMRPEKASVFDELL